MICAECGKETTNPRFCSRSCAAKCTNREHPKNKTKRTCIVCGQPVASYRHSRCLVHRTEYNQQLHWFKYKTVGEYRRAVESDGKHPSQRHNIIRVHVRVFLKHLIGKPCQRCGYTLHTEFCHIRPVSDFPDSALLTEINAESNVLILCPNCHWELDHGVWSL